MPVFVREVLIDAPVDVVFGFHERDDALELLTPAFPPVRIIEKRGGIQPGGQVVLRVGLVFRWVAVHTAYEKNRLFVDEQVEGPFDRWEHRHEFEPIDGRTRLTDRVTYRLKGGDAITRLASPLVTTGLNRMFRQRHAVTRRFCERRPGPGAR